MERFARFFDELRGAFLEREDVLSQVALALLAKEHVLMTGPPGTGKSLLASSVLGRILCEDSGEPSLFSKQLTESTVQTDLIGSVDFRTLTDTGRTEHFTDEGMLGAVHAFLDEVLDGRDMLLRATLNLLEERELKQGQKVTKGQIECALMTTNRYLSEALAEGRKTLLAFVDRIAFVSFVPRGFSDAANMRRVVEAALSGGMDCKQRLTIQDLDVLQAMVMRVRIPPEVSAALVELAQRFERDAYALERADPTFAPTRYLSTRALVRLGKILRAIVVLDRASARPDRALVAEGADLGALRLGLMLAGPPLAELDRLLENESEARERRQLQIMKAEAQIFRDALRDLPPIEIEEPPAPEPPAEVRDEPRANGLLERVMHVLQEPGSLSAIRDAHLYATECERADPSIHDAATESRAHLLHALHQTVSFFRAEGLAEELVFLEEAVQLRADLLAQGADPSLHAQDGDAFGAAIEALGARYAREFDERLQVLAHASSERGDDVLTLLDELAPLLASMEAEEARYHRLTEGRTRPSREVAARRISAALRAAYRTFRADADVPAAVQPALTKLERMGLRDSVPLGDHLEWICEALVRSQPTPPDASPTLDGYRAQRAGRLRTPLVISLTELLDVLERHRTGQAHATIASMASALAQLPESLQQALAAVDLRRVGDTLALLEAWHEGDDHAGLLRVCFDEQALLRACLEAELVSALFPHGSAEAAALVERAKALGSRLRGSEHAAALADLEERWKRLESTP